MSKESIEKDLAQALREQRTNPFQYDNEQAQRLSDLWFSQQETATIEQKNKVGLVYISKVLGLGNVAARRFAQGDRKIYHQVGLRHGGVVNYTPDLKSFWAKIQELFPGAYTDEDIAFLAEDEKAPWTFICEVKRPRFEESLLGALLVNAHVYK